MAYTAPSAVAIGDASTASLYNTYVKDNILDHESRITKLLLAVPATSTITNQSTSTTSTSFVDSGLSVSITPSTSSCLVLVSFLLNFGTDGGAFVRANLVRGATNIAQGADCTVGNYVPSSAISSHSGVFIDSPGTTSATTYKIQWRVSGSTGHFNRRGDGTDVGPISFLSVRQIAQ